MVQSPRVRQRRCAAAPPLSNALHHNLRLAIEQRPIGALNPPRRALRKHGKRQLSALMASVKDFGILKPILIDEEGHIIAGHGVWLAAKELGMAEVPVICVTHLSPEQLRLYAIADNQIPTLEEPWEVLSDQLHLNLFRPQSGRCQSRSSRRPSPGSAELGQISGR